MVGVFSIVRLWYGCLYRCADGLDTLVDALEMMVNQRGLNDAELGAMFGQLRFQFGDSSFVPGVRAS